MPRLSGVGAARLLCTPRTRCAPRAPRCSSLPPTPEAPWRRLTGTAARETARKSDAGVRAADVAAACPARCGLSLPRSGGLHLLVRGGSTSARRRITRFQAERSKTEREKREKRGATPQTTGSARMRLGPAGGWWRTMLRGESEGAARLSMQHDEEGGALQRQSLGDEGRDGDCATGGDCSAAPAGEADWAN